MILSLRDTFSSCNLSWEITTCSLLKCIANTWNLHCSWALLLAWNPHRRLKSLMFWSLIMEQHPATLVLPSKIALFSFHALSQVFSFILVSVDLFRHSLWSLFFSNLCCHFLLMYFLLLVIVYLFYNSLKISMFLYLWAFVLSFKEFSPPSTSQTTCF